MSKTPRTDAAYIEADQIEYATDADVTIAMRDFARDLERENDELRKDKARLELYAGILEEHLDPIGLGKAQHIAAQQEATK